MKLLKYILIAIVFAATTGEAFGQAKVLSGKSDRDVRDDSRTYE